MKGAARVAPQATVKSQIDEDRHLAVYQNRLNDYNEMVTQFGFLTLFAMAFPLAPLFAFFNNVIEIRTDSTILLKFCQRPVPERAASIGTWLRILEEIEER